MEKPTTNIDAVRLVRRIRDAHHEELKGASRATRIAFYNGKVRGERPGDGRVRPSVDRPSAAD